MDTILFIGIGTAGDVYPLVAIAKALNKKEYNIEFATTSNFKSIVEKNGIKYRQILDDQFYTDLINHPGIHELSKTLELVADYFIEKATPAICDFIKTVSNKEDKLLVIAAGTAAFGTRMAQEKYNISTILVHLTNIGLPSKIVPPRTNPYYVEKYIPSIFQPLTQWLANYFIIGPKLCNPLNKIRVEHNLPKIETRNFGAWYNDATSLLAMFPTWYTQWADKPEDCKPPSDLPSRAVFCGFPLYDGKPSSYQMPEDVDIFLKKYSKPLLISLGSGSTKALSLYKTCAEVAEQLEAPMIFLSKNQENIPKDLSDWILVKDYLPHSHILPLTSGIVHHGGVGTAAEALRAGTYQIIVPSVYDQYDTARRVTTLGCGDEIALSRFNQTTLTNILTSMKNNRCEEVAAYIKDTCEKNSISTAVKEIERVAALPKSYPALSTTS